MSYQHEIRDFPDLDTLALFDSVGEQVNVPSELDLLGYSNSSYQRRSVEVWHNSNNNASRTASATQSTRESPTRPLQQQHIQHNKGVIGERNTVKNELLFDEFDEYAFDESDNEYGGQERDIDENTLGENDGEEKEGKSGREKHKKRAPIKKWTREEDALLRSGILSYVQQNKPIDYETVALAIPGRSVKQAKERWKNSLNPTIKKGEWSNGELLTLLDLIIAKAQNWTDIQKQLYNRSMHCIKSKGRKLLGETLSKRLFKRCAETKNKTSLTPPLNSYSSSKKQWNTEEEQALLSLHSEYLNKHSPHLLLYDKPESSATQENQSNNLDVFEYACSDDIEVMLETVCIELGTGRPTAQIDRRLLQTCACRVCVVRKGHLQRTKLDFKIAWTQTRAKIVKLRLLKEIKEKNTHDKRIKRKPRRKPQLSVPSDAQPENEPLSHNQLNGGRRYTSEQSSVISNNNMSLATDVHSTSYTQASANMSMSTTAIQKPTNTSSEWFVEANNYASSDPLDEFLGLDLLFSGDEENNGYVTNSPQAYTPVYSDTSCNTAAQQNSYPNNNTDFYNQYEDYLYQTPQISFSTQVQTRSPQFSTSYTDGDQENEEEDDDLEIPLLSTDNNVDFQPSPYNMLPQQTFDFFGSEYDTYLDPSHHQNSYTHIKKEHLTEDFHDIYNKDPFASFSSKKHTRKRDSSFDQENIKSEPSNLNVPVNRLRKVDYNLDPASQKAFEALVENALRSSVGEDNNETNGTSADEFAKALTLTGFQFGGTKTKKDESDQGEGQEILTMIRNYSRATSSSAEQTNLAKKVIQVFSEFFSTEQLSNLHSSMKKNQIEWLNPTVCFMLDKLKLTPDRDDVRYTREYLCPSNASFDPNRVTGTYILNYVNRVFVDVDKQSKELARGNMLNEHSWKFVPSRLEAVLRIYYIIPQLFSTGEAWSYVRMYRCDGSQGIFLCQYRLLSREKLLTIVKFQDVSDRMQHVLNLPPDIY